MLNKQTSVLVTGGAGFIGANLVKRLLLAGCEVTVIDRNDGAQNRLGTSGQLKILNLSLRDALLLHAESVRTSDIIFHLAGNSSVQSSIADPIADFEAAVGDSLRLLNVLRTPTPDGRVPRQPLLVFPSSAAVYGDPASIPIKESDPTCPISPYGVSKLAVEKYIDVYCRLYGLRAVVLRAFSVYGPGQKKQVIYDILEKLALDPQRLEILGDGTQRRDFIHIDDFVSLMMHCVQLCPENGNCEVLNAATGSSTSINELAQILFAEMAVAPTLLHTGTSRPGDPQKWEVDVSRLIRTGYRPSMTLSKGLKSVVDWHRNLPIKCES